MALTVLLEDARKPEQRVRTKIRSRKSASIREVRLVGTADQAQMELRKQTLSPGDRVRIAGRDYQVRAAQASPNGDGLGVGESPGYVHLAEADQLG